MCEYTLVVVIEISPIALNLVKILKYSKTSKSANLK